MTDEQFAQWLQDQEFQQQRQRQGSVGGNGSSSEDQQRLAAEQADAEYARRLASEEEEQRRRQQQRQQQQQLHAAPSNAIALQHGQTMAVRLQHPGTKNQIDEPLYAHHVGRNVMMFEMVKKRGTYLRVKDSCDAEFSRVADEAAQFFVENCNAGQLYLGAVKHSQKVNIAGGVGWMLALTSSGALIGNAPRDAMSRWRLLAAPDAPPYTPPDGSTGRQPGPGSSTSQSSSIGVANPMQAQSLQDTDTSSSSIASSNGSRRLSTVKNQLNWLESSVGQTWLSEDKEGRNELKQLHEAGKLKMLLYRPDWPVSALQWKDYSHLHGEYVGGASRLDINFEDFFSKGYTLCRGAIDSSLTRNALKIVNYWLGQYPNHPLINPQGNIDLSGEILRDHSMLALIYESGIMSSIAKLFAPGYNVNPCLKCCISLRFPDFSTPLNVPVFTGKKWFVDKFDAGESYSLLVAVPLSATMSDGECEGNLCLFPGRHKEVFEARKAASVSRDNSMYNVMEMSKPDFGDPEKLCLNIGDVVFSSSCTPRREEPNFSPSIKYMVYFRISVLNPLGGNGSCAGEDVLNEYSTSVFS